MDEKEKRWKNGGNVVGNSGGAMYGIGILGAAVYYILHATNFWMGILGIIKAIFWPGFLLFRVYELLKM